MLPKEIEDAFHVWYDSKFDVDELFSNYYSDREIKGFLFEAFIAGMKTENELANVEN